MDEKYEGLNCDIKKVTKKEADKIEQLLAHTHAPTHSAYKKIKLINAFKLNASTQNEASFKAHNKKHRKLLWHGTRLTNVAGILKQGLRIAPPEAPCTGYMFGKGVYFADSCSKSANYCHPNNFGGDTQRFLFLADVAIGEPHKIYGSDYNAPDRMRDHKKDSVQGVGKMNYETIGEEKFLGAYVPKINKKTSGCILKDTDTEDKTYLMYNEFIIYDTSQINLKYLCHVDFEYGGSSFW